MPRLGLALSGGGFRASLYHLGVVRFLRDAGFLPQVTHIASVSGGSILAAHLVLNWQRYNGTLEEFDAAAADFLKFVRLDVRNRILRRVPLCALGRLLLFFGPARLRNRLTMVEMLRSYYEKHLYGDKCVYQLPEQPELHILATNVSEGSLCSFTRAGLKIQHRGRGGASAQPECLPARLASVSLAVAASSAFPGFFPLVPIHAEEIGLQEGDFPTQTFTDGGVYDNLGVRLFEQLKNIAPPLDKVLVSDAGAPFKVLANTSLGIIGRSLRASEVLWNRVWELEKANFGNDPRFLFLPIVETVDPEEDPTAPDPVIQTQLSGIRTDLDRFSTLEICSLVRHGYCVARKYCRRNADFFGTDLPTLAPWDPEPKSSPASGPTGESKTAAAAVASADQANVDARTLRRSAGRRVWSVFFDFRDWPTYVYLPLLIMLFGVLPVVLWRFYQQARFNAHVIDAIAHGDPTFRKVLDLVQRDPAADWSPQEVKSVDQLAQVDYADLEFISDTLIIDLRHWNPESRDRAHVVRRIRVRKMSPKAPLVIQYRDRHPNMEWRCGPSRFQPIVRKSVAKNGEGETNWEIAFNLSEVPPGRVVEVELEAFIHDIQAIFARRGERGAWIKYDAKVRTNEASVWLLFPADRKYEKYELITFSTNPTDPPTPPQPVDTQYTIDHPYGDIIAWVIANPKVGNTYQCRWQWRE